jgi:uncharacterized protein (DUF2062 family)
MNYRPCRVILSLASAKQVRAEILMRWTGNSRYLERLVSLDDSPQRIALGFAVGVFLAFTPLLGLHTLLGLLLAFAFGLNRVAVLVGLFINNPWTLFPIYGLATYVGGLFVGFPPSSHVPPLGFGALFQTRFWVEMAGKWAFWKPLLLGSAILSCAAAAFSYILTLLIVRRMKSAGKGFRWTSAG